MAGDDSGGRFELFAFAVAAPCGHFDALAAREPVALDVGRRGFVRRVSVDRPCMCTSLKVGCVVELVHAPREGRGGCQDQNREEVHLVLYNTIQDE